MKDERGFFSDAYKYSESNYAMSMHPRKKEFRYTERIPLGTSGEGRIVRVDMRHAERITVIGSSGTGKTWLIRSLMDRAYKAGIIPVVLGDLKPNFYTSMEPMPEDEAKILKNEETCSLLMKIYYPMFFKHFTNTDMPFEYQQISFKISELNVNDFMSLLSIELSDDQKTLIQTVWRRFNGIDELIGAVKSAEGFSQNTKTSVINAVNNIIKYNVIGNNSCNMTDDIRMGIVPVLCLAGEGSLGEYKHFMTTYVSIVLRKIMEDARSGSIGRRIMIVIDEAPRYMPRLGDTPLKTEILECIDKGREWEISMIFSCQRSNSLPPQVLGQSRYVLMAKVEEDTAVSIFKMFTLLDSYQTQYRFDVREIMKSMKWYRNGEREWMLIETRRSTHTIFLPLSPLSRHLHEHT